MTREDNRGVKLLKYFIIFTIIGFAIGRFIPSPKVGFFYIAFISIFWGSHSEVIWGLAALGELSLGYLVATIFVNSRSTSTGAASPPPGQDTRR